MKPLVRSFLCILILMTAGRVRADQFQAGAAACDITPDLTTMKVPSVGYGARGDKPMQGVHDPVKCKALIVQDGAAKAAIVTCDLIGISNELRNYVLADITDLGLDDRNLMMTASHTHSGPGAMQNNFIYNQVFGRYNDQLTRETAGRIAEALHQADAAMVPAAISVAVTALADVTRNRRDPAGSYNYDTRRYSAAYDPNHPHNLTDPDATVIRIDSLEGRTIAVVFNFAAHGTALGPDNMQISADWPGVAQRRIEEAVPGAVALFINGAIGDQAPTMIDNDGVSDFDYVELIGAKVADGVVGSLAGAVPAEASPVVAVMERREVPPSNVVMGYKVPKALVKHYFPEMPLQVVRLGDVAIMGAPLEMVVEVGLALKNGARGQGVKYPVVAGLANGALLYCAAPDDFEQGGYEVGNTIFGEIEAGLVIGEQMLLVRKAGRK